MARRFKTMTDDERDREYSQRLERGLPFIESDLPQFRPRDGENFIRIVPPLEDDDLSGAWGVDLICHYIEGFGWVLSPKSLDQSNYDPIDDLIRELRKIDPDLESMVRTSRKTIMHILDFNQNEQDGDLKLWAAPPTLVEDFVKASKDKRSGRMHSLENAESGFPLSFEKSGTGLQTRYTMVQLERDPFPIEEGLADDIEYFEDVLVVLDDEEMNRIVEKILDGARTSGGRGRDRDRGRVVAEVGIATTATNGTTRTHRLRDAAEVGIETRRKTSRAVEGVVEAGGTVETRRRTRSHADAVEAVVGDVAETRRRRTRTTASTLCASVSDPSSGRTTTSPDAAGSAVALAVVTSPKPRRRRTSHRHREAGARKPAARKRAARKRRAVAVLAGDRVESKLDPVTLTKGPRTPLRRGSFCGSDRGRIKIYSQRFDNA